MKRGTQFALVMGICLAIAAPAILFGAMNKSKAITEAHKLWGDWSRVDNGISWGETFDTYRIGFNSPGCGNVTSRAVGEGVGSWDAAFAAMPADKGISATVTGVVAFRETTLGTFPVVSTGPVVGTVEPPGNIVSQDPVAGLLTAAQLVIDGKLYGTQLPIVGAPWTVDLPVDSKLMSNGPHVVCTKLAHMDGSSTFTTPGMFVVANP